MRRAVLAALLVWLPAAVDGPRAGSARTWTIASAEEFARGTLDGAALDGEGRVTLAPTLVELWGPDEGVVWDVESDGAGGAFVAASSPTRVLRVGPGREPETWHATGDETLVAALLADGKGGLYLGLSPAGRLLHGRAPGALRDVAETGALFIWALAASADGSVWVGTGLPGRLLRVDPRGRVESLFESGDDPVRCIAALDAGGVVLGTGGRGRVIRVDGAGRPFVLFDADETEVVALEVEPDGTVLALTARAGRQTGAARVAAATVHETVRVTADVGEIEGDEETPAEEESPEGAPERRRTGVRFETPPGGALYRIAADGDHQRLWDSRTEVPFGLVRRDATSWLVATGDDGRIHAIDSAGRASVVVQLPSEQASALGRGPHGSILVGGTTDARAAFLEPALGGRGSWQSVAHDAGTVADWGRLRWQAERPAGAVVRAAVRGGNTAEPDETWTDWAPVEGEPEAGATTRLPPTRWAQVRLELEPGRGGVAPRVRHVELHYRPRNRRPLITALEVHPVGVVWSAGPSAGTRTNGPLVASDPVSERTAAGLATGAVAPRSVRRSYELGARTVAWQAADPDGDTLTYRVDVRREGSEAWIPLADEVEDDFLSWDARVLPDGLYRVRLMAADARDNPDGKRLEASRESGPFHVDNTRPSVEAPSLRRTDGGLRVEFVARDPGGSLAAAEIAVDGGAWEPVDPTDGVADSEEERYTIVLAPREGRAPRAIKVRVTDAAGNTAGDAWSVEPPAS